MIARWTSCPRLFCANRLADSVRRLLILLSLFVAACSSERPPVVVHAVDAAPERLSEWGVVFASGNSLIVNDDVLPYELSTPLFTDYALKLRTVWMPDGTEAIYRADREFEFPVGTVISKTFHYEKANGFSTEDYRVIRADREMRLDDGKKVDLDRYVLLETRLLVRYENGWKALPYVWNTDQTEAWLEVAGDVRSITFAGEGDKLSFAYIVPDANQCGGCHAPDHTAKQIRPIGPKAWQLNRDYDYTVGTMNQLEHWASTGILAGLVDDRPRSIRWSAPESASLQQRAMAYLDINCAHCHNAAGAADTSGLHLDIDAPLNMAYGICKSPVAVGRGSGNRSYDITPGQPEQSIMLYRMGHTDPAIAMPELGRSTIHTEGVQLITEWVASLGGEC